MRGTTLLLLLVLVVFMSCCANLGHGRSISKAQAIKKFKTADTNKDCVISPAEFSVFYTEFALVPVLEIMGLPGLSASHQGRIRQVGRAGSQHKNSHKQCMPMSAYKHMVP